MIRRTLSIGFFGFTLAYVFCSCTSQGLQSAIERKRGPNIKPDYRDLTIPPNIAPLNFSVNENAKVFIAQFYGKSGGSFKVTSRNGDIKIPLQKWKSLLQQNRGAEYYCDIFIKEKSGVWMQFETICNKIAEPQIDRALFYQLIDPDAPALKKNGIYQRDLASFDEQEIITHRMIKGNGIRFYSICLNEPAHISFHIQAEAMETLCIHFRDEWRKLDFHNIGIINNTIPAWHPRKNIIAFTANIADNFYHTLADSSIKNRRQSNIILYDIQKNKISTLPLLTSYQSKTFPAWSREGRYLYFSALPILKNRRIFSQNRKIGFDLMRVKYIHESNEWGELEKLISSKTTGKSSLNARPSPDGKFVMYCAKEPESLSIDVDQCDLYLYDVATLESFRLDISSDKTNIFHSWSQNSRWFVFTSNRSNSHFRRLYISYIDDRGQLGRPFILPQKEPHFYEKFFLHYNLPELSANAAEVKAKDISNAVLDDSHIIHITGEQVFH